MNKQQLAIIKKDVVDVVTAKINVFKQNGELDLPPDYSPDNAMKSAFLVLQDTVDRNDKPVLEVCTQNSIANALLSMVVQGLNPLKKQVDFIAYGKKLVAQRSYFGAMAVAKRVDQTIGDFAYEVVYQGDTLEYEIVRGKKVITKHKQNFGNVDKTKIVGAYCIIIGTNGEEKTTTLMTFDEIKNSWKMSKMKPIDDQGNVKPSSTHGKYTADMSLRTVINKACKFVINSSSDSSILVRAIKKADDIVVEAEFADEVDVNANQEAIDIKADPEPGEPGSVVDAELAEPEQSPTETQPQEIPVDESQAACGF